MIRGVIMNAFLPLSLIAIVIFMCLFLSTVLLLLPLLLLFPPSSPSCLYTFAFCPLVLGEKHPVRSYGELAVRRQKPSSTPLYIHVP